MSSGLDCVECGGFISLERPSKRGLCRSCEMAERAAAEAADPEFDELIQRPREPFTRERDTLVDEGIVPPTFKWPAE